MSRFPGYGGMGDSFQYFELPLKIQKTIKFKYKEGKIKGKKGGMLDIAHYFTKIF